MAVRWHFVEEYLADATRWSWRVLEMDGTIERQSQSFPTYGEAVIEAIRHGFQPRQDHWVVATRHAISHFRPGKPPLTVPCGEGSPADLERHRRSRARVRLQHPPALEIPALSPRRRG